MTEEPTLAMQVLKEPVAEGKEPDKDALAMQVPEEKEPNEDNVATQVPMETR